MPRTFVDHAFWYRVVADPFHGELDELKAAVAHTGIAGTWQTGVTEGPAVAAGPLFRSDLASYPLLAGADPHRSTDYEARASSHQVRDPHNSDHLPVIERLLLCALIASPNVVLLRCDGLTVLHDS